MKERRKKETKKKEVKKERNKQTKKEGSKERKLQPIHGNKKTSQEMREIASGSRLYHEIRINEARKQRNKHERNNNNKE